MQNICKIDEGKRWKIFCHQKKVNVSYKLKEENTKWMLDEKQMWEAEQIWQTQ